MDIKEMIDSNFRGIIKVIQNGKILCENVTGYADLPNESLIQRKQSSQALRREKYLLRWEYCS